MSMLSTRILGAMSMMALTLILLGCMSLSFGGRNYTTQLVDEQQGVLCQEGKVKVGPGEERTVYYPVPYASPPNLDVTAGQMPLELLDQKPDHFRVRWRADQIVLPGMEVCWKARGVRQVTLCAVPTPPETIPPPPLPLRTLPPPVETPKN